MKISCSRSSLMNGINIVSKAVSTKSTMETLQCILIEVSLNEIKLIANDMEMGIETVIEGTVLEAGKVALDSKLLNDFVRKLPDSDILMETNDKYEVHIKCERIESNLPGINGDNFNYLPEVSKDKYMSISQFTLKEVIHQTIFSISDREDIKILTGELFEVKDDTLRIASLDGHRISIRKVQLKESYDNMKVIVPGKTLNDISKIITGGIDDEIKMYVTDKHILFEFDNTKVVSRLLEGKYYDIDQMISDEYEIKIEINKNEFYNSIDRSTLFIKESDRKPLIVNIEGSSIHLNVNSSLGSMSEEIEIKKEGKNLRIGFNPRYLMDALRVIDDENITLYMMNPKSPCYIRNEDSSYIYVILPVGIAA